MEEILDLDKKDINADELTAKRFDRILLSFLIHEPFFSDIIRMLRKEQTQKIQTAGVGFDGSSIVLYYNPHFLSTLTNRQVFGLLKHECYHIIYKHISSRKQDPPLMWNIATDLAINSTIPKMELPPGGLIPGCKIEMPEGVDQDDEFFAKRNQFSDFIYHLPPNKASEWYMEQIMNNQEVKEAIEEMMSPQSDGSCPACMSGEDSENSDGDNKECSHSGPGTGGSGIGFDHHFENELTDGDKDFIDGKIKEILEEAVKRADESRGWGSVSSSTAKSIRSYVFKGVNWKNVLRYFCGTKQRANKSRTFKKINRKYPYQHPGSKIGRTSNIAVYIDQSGSVSDVELQLFFSTLNELAKKTTFTIFHFDCTVDENSRHLWKKNKKIDRAYRTRGGGTDFTSVENFHRKIQNDFDGYIVFTDGQAPKPIICKSKRCWVLLPGTKTYFTPDKNDVVVTMER